MESNGQPGCSRQPTLQHKIKCPRKSTNTQPMATTRSRPSYESHRTIDCWKHNSTQKIIHLRDISRSTLVTGFDHFPTNLDVLALKTWGQRLSQFIGLLGVLDLQCVQVTRASDLELGFGITLADLDKLGVAPACLLKKVSDISNLLWHCCVLLSAREQNKR